MDRKDKLKFLLYKCVHYKKKKKKKKKLKNITNMFQPQRQKSTLWYVRQGRFRSDCAISQSDQNLHWRNLYSQGCKFSSCGQRRLWSDCMLIWVSDGCTCQIEIFLPSSRKHAYIMLTPETPLLYSKTGVYRGIHYFSCFFSKHTL